MHGSGAAPHRDRWRLMPVALIIGLAFGVLGNGDTFMAIKAASDGSLSTSTRYTYGRGDPGTNSWTMKEGQSAGVIIYAGQDFNQASAGTAFRRIQLQLKGCSARNSPMWVDVFWNRSANAGNDPTDQPGVYSTGLPFDRSKFTFVSTSYVLPSDIDIIVDITPAIRYLPHVPFIQLHVMPRNSTEAVACDSVTDDDNNSEASSEYNTMPLRSVCDQCLGDCPAVAGGCAWAKYVKKDGVCIEWSEMGNVWSDPMGDGGVLAINNVSCIGATKSSSTAATIFSTRSASLTAGVAAPSTDLSNANLINWAMLRLNGGSSPSMALIWFDDLNAVTVDTSRMRLQIHVPWSDPFLGRLQNDTELYFVYNNSISPDTTYTNAPNPAEQMYLGRPNVTVRGDAEWVTLTWDVSYLAQYSSPPLVFLLRVIDTSPVAFAFASSRSLIPQSRATIVIDEQQSAYFTANLPALSNFDTCQECMMECPEPLGGCYWNGGQCVRAQPTVAFRDENCGNTLMSIEALNISSFTGTTDGRMQMPGYTRVTYVRFNIATITDPDIKGAVFRMFRDVSGQIGSTPRGIYWIRPPTALGFQDYDFDTLDRSERFLIYGYSAVTNPFAGPRYHLDYAVKLVRQAAQLFNASAELILAYTVQQNESYIPFRARSLWQATPRLLVTVGDVTYPDLRQISDDTCVACMTRGFAMVGSRNFGFCVATQQCLEGSIYGPFGPDTCAEGWYFGGCEHEQDTQAIIVSDHSTFINSRDASQVFDNAEYLMTVADTGGQATVLVHFPLPFSYPQIGGVRLQLFSSSPANWFNRNSFTVYAYDITNHTWANTTYSTRPTYYRNYNDAVNKNSTAACTTLACPVEFDVTRSVFLAQYNPGNAPKQISFALVMTITPLLQKILFHSDAQNLMPQFKPRLVFDLTTDSSDILNSTCQTQPASSCDLCLRIRGCGWCDSTQSCWPGYGGVPQVPCKGVGAWYYNSCPVDYTLNQPQRVFTKVAATDSAQYDNNTTLTSTPPPQFFPAVDFAPSLNAPAWLTYKNLTGVRHHVAYTFDLSSLKGVPDVTASDYSIPVSSAFPGPGVTGRSIASLQIDGSLGLRPSYTVSSAMIILALLTNDTTRELRFSGLGSSPTPNGIYIYQNVAGGYQWVPRHDTPFPDQVPLLHVNDFFTADLNPLCYNYTRACTCVRQPGCLWCDDLQKCFSGPVPGACGSVGRYYDKCPGGYGGTHVYNVTNTGGCECVNCAPGFVGREEGCERCPPGLIAGKYSKDCIECGSGQEPSPDLTTCKKCREGFMNDRNGSICDPCPPGTIGPGEGRTTCDICPSQTIQLAYNATVCPPCPPGLICIEEGLTTRILDAGYGGCCGEAGIAACYLAKSCPGGPCPAMCPGFVCAEGYEGNYCEACTKNGTTPYHRVGGECEPCPKYAYLFIILAIILIILLCAFLFKYGRTISTHLTSVSIGLGYTQAVGLFTNFNFNLPPFLKDFISALSITNLSSNFINTDCAFPELSFVVGFSVKLLLPVIVLVVFATMYAVVKLHSVFVQKTVINYRTRNQNFVRERNMSLRGCARLKDYLRWQYVRFRTKYKSTLELSLLKSRIINAYITFLVLAYLFTSQTALEVFACVPDANGNYYVANSNAVLCKGPEFNSIKNAAGGALFIYTLGLPVIFTGILIANRVEAQLGDEKFIARYGMLFSRYKPGRFFWELIIMLRKFGVVGCAIFAPILKPKYGTAIILIFIFLLAGVLQLWGKPYRLIQHNFLEAALIVVYVLALITAASASEGGDIDTASVFLLIFFAVGLALVFFVLVYDLAAALRRALGNGKGAAIVARVCGGNQDDDRKIGDGEDTDESAREDGKKDDTGSMKSAYDFNRRDSDADGLRNKPLPAKPLPASPSGGDGGSGGGVGSSLEAGIEMSVVESASTNPVFDGGEVEA